MPGRKLLSAVAVAALPLLAAGATDWPQYRRTADRRGYTPDNPSKIVFRVKWDYLFKEDRIGESAQPIVTRDVLYLGTKRGRIVALAIADGSPIWDVAAGGPILHSPAAVGDLIVANSLDGFVYAVAREDGAPAWKTDTGFGLSTAPCVAGGGIFVANREGYILRLDPDNGTVRWRTRCGPAIFHTPAAHDGLVFAGSEDMRVYAVDMETGKVHWRTEPLPGITFEGRGPVVAQGKVLVRTMPAWVDQFPDNFSGRTNKDPLAEKATRFGRALSGLSHDLPEGETYFEPADKDNFGKMWDVFGSIVSDPQRLARHQQFCREFFTAHPLYRDLFAIDEKTGEIPHVSTVWFSCCSGGPCPEPVADAAGRLYTPSSMFGDSLHSIVRAGLVRLNLADASVAAVVTVGGIAVNGGRNGFAPPDEKGGFVGPECTADETVHFTIAGDLLVGQREMAWPAAFDMKTGTYRRFYMVDRNGFRRAYPHFYVPRGSDIMANGCAPVVYGDYIVGRRGDYLQVFFNEEE